MMCPEIRVARNVEIKARIGDVERLLARARRLSGAEPRMLVQEDTFFDCPHGRLKLRVSEDASGELIFYDRADVPAPKESAYVVVPVSNPALLRRALGGALGIRGVVRKRRALFLIGETRLHVDEVEGLGWFLELEVVLTDGQDSSEGIALAQRLMNDLGVEPSHLVRGAYLDLLQQPKAGPA